MEMNACMTMFHLNFKGENKKVSEDIYIFLISRRMHTKRFGNMYICILYCVEYILCHTMLITKMNI